MGNGGEEEEEEASPASTRLAGSRAALQARSQVVWQPAIHIPSSRLASRYYHHPNPPSPPPPTTTETTVQQEK